MFATNDRRRTRVVAAVVGTVVALAAVVVGLVGPAFLLGLDAPRLRLPQYETYAEPRLGGSRWLVRSGTPTLGLWPFVLLTLAVIGIAAGAVAFAGRFHRTHPPGRHAVRSRERSARRVGRWWAVGLVVGLLALTAGLAVHHYTADTLARDRHVDDGRVALAVGVGPVMDVRADGVRSVHSYRRHVALTFDDGPDPTWTPKILAVLRREHVVGTFFAIGEQVTRHPEVARQVVAGGNEIGVHTYRHVEVTSQTPAALRRDLRLTQLAIVGATGHRTGLFRPPFITDRENVGIRQYVALEEASRLGYVTVLADRDSTDWSRPGVAAIARRSFPSFGSGAIIEFHDGGGDRSQTVAALTPLIRLLKHAGYQFDTVSGMARLAPRRVIPTASLPVRLWAGTSLWFVDHSDEVSFLFFVLVVFAAIVSLLRVALTIVWSRPRRDRGPAAGAMPVSVVIAAYDEAPMIERTLASVAALGPVVTEIVVVDDGSLDATAAIARSFPDDRVRVVERPHEGKAAALRVGFAECGNEIIVTVDADTRPAPDALRPLLAPFGDPRVGAVSGNLRAADTKGALGAAQQLEYVIANAFDRRALDRWSTQVTVPGAIGAFRRSALVGAGGIRTATVAEDTDLTLAIVDTGWLVRFAPDALATTEVPGSIGALWRQRSRWSFGIAQSLWSRRSMARDVRHRPRPALTWLGAFVVHVALPLAAPLLDLAALWSLVVRDWWPIALWLLVAAAQFVAAVVAVRRERAPARMLWAFPLHLFGYRQITSLVVCQTVAWAVAGRWPEWGRRPQPVDEPPVAAPEPVIDLPALEADERRPVPAPVAIAVRAG